MLLGDIFTFWVLISMDTKYLSVESYDAYKISFQQSNYVWNIIIKWKYFEKDIYQLIHYTNTKLKY